MFNIGDYVLSNYMLGLGYGEKEAKVYGIGRLVKFNYLNITFDFGIRCITTSKVDYKTILEGQKNYDRSLEVFCCHSYNLRPLELTDPHFINAILNQVFIEKEEEIKFKEYIRVKIQTDFKIPTLDSEPEKDLIGPLATLITVEPGHFTEDLSTYEKPKVVFKDCPQVH